jgi:acetyltransferase-like isoleucine patch superfamily enzyme
MQRNSFFTEKEIKELGFKECGSSILISSKASFYDIESIIIGNHVRIDDFCILSGHITIGSYVHISAYTALYGKMGIELGDFSGLSPRVIVFSATDDFSGNSLIGPTVPKIYTNVCGGKVVIGKYVQVGAGSIVMPKVIIGEGAAIGAMSLVKNDIEEWIIAAGIPAVKLRERNRNLIIKATDLFSNEK